MDGKTLKPQNPQNSISDSMFGLQGGQAPVRSAALPSLTARAFSVRSSNSLGPSRVNGEADHASADLLLNAFMGSLSVVLRRARGEVGQLGGRCSSTDLAVRQQQSLRQWMV